MWQIFIHNNKSVIYLMKNSYIEFEDLVCCLNYSLPADLTEEKLKKLFVLI
jgi:hypothetical protein